MHCKFCGNTETRYFKVINSKVYCRKCIKFKRSVFKENEITSINNPEFNLGFSLTKNQVECSNQLLEMINVCDCVVYAACGAGKTEIVLETIKRSIDQGMRVGFSIPRRQVVLELGKRLSEYYSNLKIVTVCEGYTEEILGDLVICTTHQLFRYSQYFDLLIIDEPDAFPYKNNDVLKNFARNSCKGNIIYLSATPDKDLLSKHVITLFKRPHNKPLPVPFNIITNKFLLIVRLWRWIKTHNYSLIFVPTIQQGYFLSKIFNIPFVCSKTSNNEEIIRKMMNKEIEHLMTTTILERGVTFKGIDVLVLFADHLVYDEASLIQIAGRVGRDSSNPTGEVTFLSLRKSMVVKRSIRAIERMNA